MSTQFFVFLSFHSLPHYYQVRNILIEEEYVKSTATTQSVLRLILDDSQFSYIKEVVKADSITPVQTQSESGY